MNWLDVLSPEARAAVAHWSVPCESAFDALAGQHPADLLRLCTAGVLRPGCLTFAAEAAGRIADSGAVRGALLPLLAHHSAVVREGAIYGLHKHHDAAVRDALARIAASDPSDAVRVVAADALDEFGGTP